MRRTGRLKLGVERRELGLALRQLVLQLLRTRRFALDFGFEPGPGAALDLK